MTEFTKILFPVDFSPQSLASVPFVKEMARAFGASVTVLNIVQPPAPWYPPDGGIAVSAYDVKEILNLSRDRLSEFRASHFADLAPEISVNQFHEEGDPALSIIEYAQREHVDLIMMPTHGFGLFRGLLIGSITAKVLHDAACPVWTGVHIDEEPAKQHTAIRKVLCAIDLNPSAPTLVTHSMELAARHKATLRLVHCVPGTDAFPDRYFDIELERSFLAEARQAIQAIQTGLDSNFEVSLEAGSVSQVVREAALRHKADLVVMGRGVLKATLGRLRTNAYAIIRDSPCPVVSF